MVRPSVKVDREPIQEAEAALGGRTYVETVSIALTEAIQTRRGLKLRKFFGRVDWEADLSEMLEDSKTLEDPKP